MGGSCGANRYDWRQGIDLGFYLTYTLRTLRRREQHTLLVVVSVAFGVMALVTMQMLSSVIAGALLGDPRVMRGGDLRVERPAADYLTDADIALLDALRAEGRIEAYTPVARLDSMLIKPEGGSKTGFVMYALGVEPDVFPLLGRITIRAPREATLAEVIARPGTLAVTRDMAGDLGLGVGDPVLVSDGLAGAPQRLIIGGVIEMTPEHLAKSVFYSLETARLIANNQQVITGAELVVSGDAQPLARELSASGWSVLAAEDFSSTQKRIRNVFNFGLKGAGILALLVGGIGVANTMQVLLARRTTEIAVLKTLGYRRRHLLLMFGLETAVIGAAGSLIGIGAALLVGHPLMRSMERTGIFLLEWRVEPRAIISGGVAGVTTAVIFGFYAILRASTVRPAALLRRFDSASSWQRWLSAMGVYAVLAVPFSVVSAFVMGSITQGIGVILLALAGFVGLGLVMGFALWIVIRLPMPGLRMLKLARNNLKRQPIRLLFALIALFVGVVAISFAVATISAAQREYDERLGSLDGPNLVVYARTDQDAAIQAKITGLKGVTSMYVRYPAELVALDVQIGGAWQPLDIHWMQGRQYAEPAWGLELFGAAWGVRSDGVYLPEDLRDSYGDLQPGLALRLVGSSGTAREMVLAGFYRADDSQTMSPMPRSVIVDRAVVAGLSGSDTTVIYDGEIEVRSLESATRALSAEFPAAMVINAKDVRAVVQGILMSLLSFVLTVAGFALVAGAVLIANAVGLAMIERRREIGVMKVVGYTSRHVLVTLIFEHGQLGLLSGLLGTLAAATAFRVIRETEPDVILSLQILPGLAIILVCTAFALVSVLAVAWRPTRVPPMIVLRDE
jgi:putative ABC transport system permease protein